MEEHLRVLRLICGLFWIWKIGIWRKKAWLEDACGIFAQETASIPQIKGSKLFPAFRYTEDSWVKEFEKAGIITSSFSYPTAQSPSVNRIVISGFHELEDLMYLNGIIQNLAQ
ncbi:hypothetical protein [Algoriphagus boritolerans]|uniref:hypothetical protein n=1 Tax=Algoriphagus boritolerans TaxID=308111 RepID=UPI000A942B5D